MMPTDDLFMSSVMSHKCFKNQWDFCGKTRNLLLLASFLGAEA